MIRGECLSILELFELRESGGRRPSEGADHVSSCPRCEALLRELPNLDLPIASESTVPLRARVLIGQRPAAIQSGQIWTARTPDRQDRRYIVVVLGTRRDTDDGIVVAPVSSRIDQGSDLDLFLDNSLLGEAVMITVWNYGTIFTDQLEECLGILDADRINALKALYAHIVTDQPTQPDYPTGVPTEGPEDERLLWRVQYLEDVRALWRPWRQRMAGGESESVPSTETVHQTTPRLSDILMRFFEANEWDPPTLAEEAHVATTRIEAFLSNRLDLTDQSDVDEVASVLHTLGVDFERAEGPVQSTLEASPGGLLRSLTDTDRIAARRHIEVRRSGNTRDIYEGLVTTDESKEARAKAIASYMEALSAKLDELSSS